METVTLHITDLWRDDGGWRENSSWVVRVTAKARTFRGAVRKALALARGKGYALKRDHWCQDPCWREPRSAIGAYLEGEV